MRSVSDVLAAQAGSQMALAALAAAVLGVILVLGFIFLRRVIRRRFFRRQDSRIQFICENWREIVDGEIPAESWRRARLDRQIVEDIAISRLEIAEEPEIRRLKAFLSRSGLVERHVREVRHGRRWPKRKALLALGRMQAVESLPALIEALEDGREAVVIDAVRAIGRIGHPKGGVAILERLSRGTLQLPAKTLESALAGCFRDRPSELLEMVLRTKEPLRGLTAQVLAEVATPLTYGDLLPLVRDPVAEVRASAARILAVVRPPYVSHAMAELAEDPVWFVRLRAMVAMGELGETGAIPVLIRGLCDVNRLVRLRAASALAGLEGEEPEILGLATQTADRYALQALVSEMERSGKIPRLVDALADRPCNPEVAPALVAASRGGAYRMLADLMLHHPDLRVREMLSGILVHSRDAQLLAHVEELYPRSAGEEQESLRRLVEVLRREQEAA